MFYFSVWGYPVRMSELSRAYHWPNYPVKKNRSIAIHFLRFLLKVCKYAWYNLNVLALCPIEVAHLKNLVSKICEVSCPLSFESQAPSRSRIE